jgi:hypothetical protein
MTNHISQKWLGTNLPLAKIDATNKKYQIHLLSN